MLIPVLPSKSTILVGLGASEIALVFFGLLLLIGAIGEEKEERLDRAARWPTAFRRHRRFKWIVILSLAGEFVADGGIFLFSEALQITTDFEVANAHEQTEIIRGRNLQLENLLLPRQLQPSEQMEKALSPFTKTELLIINADDAESAAFASSFEVLHFASWKVAFVPKEQCPSSGIRPGVTIWTRRPSWLWLSSAARPPDATTITPEPNERRDKTWRAAEALKSYIKSTLGIDAVHWPLDDLQRNLYAQFATITQLSDDSILLEIGNRSLDLERSQLLRLHGLPEEPREWFEKQEEEWKGDR